MWRSTERVSLEKKPSMRLSQEPCVGVKVNSKRPDRLLGEPSLGLLGDVRGMIIEDQLDRGMDRIGGVEKLEKFDEFATAVAILDEGVNLAGDGRAARWISSRKVQSLQTNTGFECTEVAPTSPSDRAVIHPVSSPIGCVMIWSLPARVGRLPVSSGVVRDSH